LIAKKSTKRENPDDDDEIPPRKTKKTKTPREPKDSGSLVKNKDLVRDWDCKAVYKQLFTGAVIKNTPAFNSSGL